MNSLFTSEVVSDEDDEQRRRWDLLSLLQQVTNSVAESVLRHGQPNTEQVLHLTLHVRVVRLNPDIPRRHAMLLPPHVRKPLWQKIGLEIRSAERRPTEHQDD